MTPDVLAPLRRLTVVGVRNALGEPGNLAELESPLGDPGLFGPGSMAWRVHSDLGTMLIGGFSALMLQMLHPLAMAGVAEHSLYREDPLGRLRRTAAYVAGTTYGPMPLVEKLLATVRNVHDHVRGVASDGRPYRADDPALLTWVHTCEVWSFLRSYQRYGASPLVASERDRYLREVAVLAERLGATSVPTSVAEVRAYFRATRPELTVTDEAREALSFLRTSLGDGPSDVVAHRIITEAALDLLPSFAREAFGLDSALKRLTAGVVPFSGRLATRSSAYGFAALLRWAVGPSIARAVALERVTGSALAER